MSTATLISLAFVFATSCLLLSLLPFLGQWADGLQMTGLLFALAGILTFIYSLFSD